MSTGGAPGAASASAPGRLELAGAGRGPRLSVALDRRALCRVEPLAEGLEVESKDLLTRTAAADRSELLARAPGSIVAHLLDALESPTGLRVVTEWKLFKGSGVDGDAALAVAAAGAVARSLGRVLDAEELLDLARQATSRAGLGELHGHHAALVGGLVRSRASSGKLEADRLEVDPGRVDECLRLVDVGTDPGGTATGVATSAPSSEPGLTDAVCEALRAGRHQDVVELLRLDSESIPATARQRAAAELVHGAGGAARPVPPGRLLAVWAPPGGRGPGRREAVEAALKGAGLKLLPVRVDLRGLEFE